MVEEKKEEEENTGPSVGALFTLFSVVMIVVVGFAIYQMVMDPYDTADDLRDILDSKENISDDYYIGWSDCIDCYLKMKTEPTNCSSGVVDLGDGPVHGP